MNKKELSERDIVIKFILPGIVKASWNVDVQVREEVSFTDGRIFVKGKTVEHGRKKCIDIKCLTYPFYQRNHHQECKKGKNYDL